VIVVIGSTYLHGDGPTAIPDGVVGRLARSAAAAGSSVELVAKIGDDPAGDGLLLALARSGVGHVAVLRDPVHPTAWRHAPADLMTDAIDGDEPVSAWATDPTRAPTLEVADVALALRYLTDYRVVVAVHPSPAIVTEVAAAADWATAHLLVVIGPGGEVPTDIPPGSLVLEATDDDADDSSIGSRLGVYAAAIDGGADPSAAYAELTAEPGLPQA
jgi:hypothetical protein